LLVGAGGATSEDERRHVIRLAEQNENIAGFILDDFFHARPWMWLAANHPKFPVTLTVKPPAATSCQHVELVAQIRDGKAVAFGSESGRPTGRP
jgi:hypothetical protein